MKDLEWLKEEVKEHIKPYDREDYLSYTAGGTDVAELILGYIDQLDEPEVLSSDWIGENVEYAYFDMLDDSGRLSSATAIIKPHKLQNLLVPKQDEVDRAYEDGYEKGKQYATEKQSEETETVAGVFVDYLIASAKLKLVLKMEVEELEE